LIEKSACSWVNPHTIKLAATATAWIEITLPSHDREERVIETSSTALQKKRTIPRKAKPSEILQQGLNRARTNPESIEIIDPQQPLPILKTSSKPGQQGSPQIAKMKWTRWGRCETAPIAFLAKIQASLKDMK
jgi:hypothetical protein